MAVSPEPPCSGVLRQYAAAFIANLSAFCIGNMLGWTSPMLPLLQSEDPPIGSEPLTDEEISWVGSVNFVGAIAGSVVWGWMSDRLGRKKTGQLVAVPFAAGWCTVLAAPSVAWLVVGRVLLGVGCSGVMINMPMFVTEIAQDDLRGRLGSFLLFSLTAGSVFCYLVGYLQSYALLTGVCLTMPLLFLALFSLLPESPVWLYVHGSGAEEAMAWYRGGDRLQAKRELDRLAERPRKARPGITSLWATRGTTKAMVIGAGFVFGQQLCGILGIATFAVKIFQMSGSVLSPHGSAAVFGLLQLTASMASTLLIDKAGRRVLLIASFFIMGVSLVLLGFYFFHRTDQVWFPIVALSFHAVAYSLGAGPVPFIVLSEIFSPELRGTAISVIQVAGTTFSFLSVKIFPTLVTNFGPHGCFWFYGVCSLLTTVFMVFCVPETKGKPLNLILNRLEGEPKDKTEDSIQALKPCLDKQAIAQPV